jgi:hypothetical protein
LGSHKNQGVTCERNPFLVGGTVEYQTVVPWRSRELTHFRSRKLTHQALIRGAPFGRPGCGRSTAAPTARFKRICLCAAAVCASPGCQKQPALDPASRLLARANGGSGFGEHTRVSFDERQGLSDIPSFARSPRGWSNLRNLLGSLCPRAV